MKTYTIGLMLCILVLAGCAGKEAQLAHGEYLKAATADRPMFRMTTHPGQIVTLTGIATLELYYPGHEPRPFVDSTAQAWAPVVSSVFSSAIPVLGMFGTVYSMGRTMRQMAPYMGDGNMQINQSAMGDLDSRIDSPDDSTHPATVVQPEVVVVP